ncbi:ESCRT-II complex, vps25 subunit [Saitoella complicata NRRL Y-17804]|uniref:ESCRT-II complex, vps25 subunit n=1 Tax=Saitoella complicata (strain BCRC 22490 / CBS 7301 / JCM 7358 / NBRC 10748 / NRRL Y-17804) TaxID=698492 RepID=UPI0008677D4A|nr:ESCRT-II complex, vps25 subunit [Saitoella complicata NRRL Y-17804]ODQ56266.1 ESCRT-II complex, vps25 subunit [Saitoella complicata NRRL Y-17804]
MASSNSNSEGFPWPKIYSFPPFFTRQPTTQTWIAQRSAWSSLLLSHARYHRRFRLSLGNDESIWENKEIGRVVKDLVRKELAEWMVHENQAAYVPNTQKQQLLLYWRKPAEWAELIYKWIDDTAQFNSVLTLYELVEHETEFKELDPMILGQALDVLKRRGLCQVFGGEDGGGVKFFKEQGR